MSKKSYMLLIAVLFLIAIILLAVVDSFHQPVAGVVYPDLQTHTPTSTSTPGWWLSLTPTP